MSMRTVAAIAAGKLAGAASRALGKGGGTALPGVVAERVEPRLAERLAAQLGHGCVVVTGTNGKTTTAHMLSSIAAEAGQRPLHNRSGSNLMRGVATALLEDAGLLGRLSEAEQRLGVFEIDEATLPEAVRVLKPKVLLFSNLFRDQLDRYGELETLADEWAEMVERRAGATAFALNADDPLIADLGRDREEEPRPGVTYFGIDDPTQALPELQHAFDAKHCRRCGHPYAYERAFVGHLGHYSCPNCGARRPEPDVSATSVELHGMSGSSVEVRTPAGELALELPLPGLYNVYNALAAIAAGLSMGVGPSTIGEALADVRAVFGRVETIDVNGVGVSILLIKNPAGANEVLRTLRLESEGLGLDLWVALNDGIADGRDVSWIWDADFELLVGSVRSVVCAGTRAPEMALRLKYAGIGEDLITVRPEISESLDEAVAAAPGRLFALPTYTALLELRRLLADRGLAKEFWE